MRNIIVALFLATVSPYAVATVMRDGIFKAPAETDFIPEKVYQYGQLIENLGGVYTLSKGEAVAIQVHNNGDIWLTFAQDAEEAGTLPNQMILSKASFDLMNLVFDKQGSVLDLQSYPLYDSVQVASNEEVSARRRDHARHSGTSGCSASLAAQRIVHIGARTHSTHRCVLAVQQAYAGCPSARSIHSGAHGVRSMAAAGWQCSHTGDPYSAPQGAVLAESNHAEIRSGNCFYSDFHLPDCRPATKYRNPRRMFGWCTPGG